MLIITRIISALSAGVIQVTLLTLAAVLAASGKQGSSIATVIMGNSTALVSAAISISSIYIIIFLALAAWYSGTPIQFQLISLAPAASGIVLSLHSAIGQVGMAAGAGIVGGLL
ncbi:hypothetical protein J7E78_03175 [Paenibacillus polymyxa]|uniref:hypothetical protein n=1 Tax=Paenibacillus polymyxa TaxID=1406 RepID=UPI001BE8DD3E|nr:hypothetical protein [Paenibacillus polymyxa]MBT2282542.1 hypothetical protein [Paenibacillus polymyxa]